MLPSSNESKKRQLVKDDLSSHDGEKRAIVEDVRKWESSAP